jgi:hypothetical protein
MASQRPEPAAISEASGGYCSALLAMIIEAHVMSRRSPDIGRHKTGS